MTYREVTKYKPNIVIATCAAVASFVRRSLYCQTSFIATPVYVLYG